MGKTAELAFCAATLQGMGDAFEQMLSSLSTLHGLSQIDVQTTSEEALLRRSLHMLVEHFDVECCSIFFCRGEELVNAVGLDWKDWGEGPQHAGRPCHPARSYPVAQSFMGLAVQTGEVQICTDCRRDPRFNRLQDGAASIAPGSLLCAPIRSCGEIIGVINISHPEPGHFSDRHSRLVSIYSDFLGQLITSSRLFRQLEEKVAVRTRQLEEALAETRLLKGHYQTLALVDPLTGLHNRRHFFTESKLALSRAVRYQRPFSLVIIDIDRFKSINDRYGHIQGDHVLREVAQALQGQLRDTDLLARVGGEEFALALPETTRIGAGEAMQRLLKTIRHLHWECDGCRVQVTISIGIVHIDADSQLGDPGGLDIDVLLNRLYALADRGMYDAKHQGGDRIVEAPFA